MVLKKNRLKYSIFDPTGNITALVEGEVDINRQPSVAAEIMELHEDVEQVGFVRFEKDRVKLRMAGGEFCGNASMCAAVLYLLRTDGQDEGTVLLQVSGAARPVEVRLRRTSDRSFSAGLCMPPALCIRRIRLSHKDISGELSVVLMEGISHIMIEKDSAFSFLKNDKTEAEAAVRAWCRQMSAEGLGLMFLEEEKDKQYKDERSNMYRLTPLVYIPGSDTLFWEHSCASGTAAAGMVLADRTGCPSEYAFLEPAGMLSVKSDPETNETRLFGKVAFNPSLNYTL